MKTRFFKWATMLVALLFSVNMSAQVTHLVISEGSIQTGGNFGSGATALTVTGVNSGSSSKAICTGLTKVDCLQIGSNFSSYLEFTAPPSSGFITEVSFDNFANNGSTATKSAIFYSTASPFDVNEVYKIDFDLPKNDEGCTPLVFDLDGKKAKSVRIYRQIYAKANSTPTDSYFLAGTKPATPYETIPSSGQSVNFRKVRVTVSPEGPVITDFTLMTGYDAVVTTAETGSTIVVNDVPYATDISAITPASIGLAGGTSFAAGSNDATSTLDFSTPQDYTVTDGTSTRTYTVTVNKVAPSTCGATGDGVRLNDDFEVVFRGNTIKASVDNSTKEIKFNIPFTTTLAELETEFAPTFTANGLLCTTDLASWTPAPCSLSGVSTSGDVIDFSTSIAENNGSTIGDNSNPAKIVIMPQDGTACEYTVKITRLAPDVKCSISEFYFVGYEQYKGTISGTDISVTLPSTANVTNLTAFVDNNSLAATPIVLPLPTDYSAAQTITVISEKEEAGIAAAPGEELTKTYTVTVTLDATAPAIQSSTPALDNSDTEFSLAGVMKFLYDEDLVAGTGDITLRIKGGTIHTTIPAASIALSGKEAKFSFSGLTDLTEYELIIPAGIFADKYGNPVAAKTIEFKTADGTLKDFPYSGCMPGEDYAVPAFITGATYNPTADTKATTPNQYGAYEIPAGASLVITADKMGSIYASIYALGGNRSFSITEGSSTGTVFATEYLYNYENKGTSIRADINATATTSVYINNDISSSGSIFVPFIYISADNTTMTANEACCK